MPPSILDRILESKRGDIEAARRRIPIERLKELAEAVSGRRPFLEALRSPGVNVIAEIKRASPSKGPIRPELDAAEQARRYEAGGAAALSVLTDTPFFKGSLADLKEARAATRLPVLRKDFIISDYQVFEAKAAGADALLLIVRALDEETLAELLRLCEDSGMDALVEVHSDADLATATRVGARLIGINNRDLSSFHTDIGTAVRLVSRMTEDQIPVAASGISGADDIARNLEAGIHNFLIGESLVRSERPTDFLKGLVQVSRKNHRRHNAEW